MSQIIAMLSAAVVFIAAVAAEAADLRDAVTIDREEVLLGDLLDGISADRAAIAVARAPRPGRVAEVPAAWVARMARAYGIDYAPASAADVVRVARASNQVDFSGIETLLRARLRPHLGSGDIVIEMDGIDRVMHLPTSVDPSIALNSFEFHRASGQFVASVVAPAGAPPDQQVEVPVRGFARAIVQVPVLAHGVQEGAVVGAGDIAWLEMDATRVPAGTARTAEDLTGLAARRALDAGQMVLLVDLQPPVVVARGSGVMIRFNHGVLTITTRGRALEDGALGASVRVTNTSSGRTLYAVVSGPNLVEADATIYTIN